MAKTKFIRVAVSGPTIDGRTIEPTQLVEAARNYNPDTYAARLNLEHIRGITGDKPFMAYGDVLALKAEDVELDVAGKKEKRVGLFAQLDVSDELVALNNKGQKLYSSIELLPNFSGTGQAYLVGAAVTDSPASLGTERLQFSTKNFGFLTAAATELNLEVEPAPAATTAQTEAAGAFSEMKKFFAGLVAAPAPATVTPAPVAAPVAAAPAPDQFAQVMTGLQTLSTAIEASSKATNEQVTKLATELAAVQAIVNKTTDTSYTKRPAATGGDGTLKAVC